MNGPENAAQAIRAPADEQARIAGLERKIVALEKTKQALMGRVERSTASAGNSYFLFEHNLTLQRQVAKQTCELQQSNQQLLEALTDLKNATDQIVESEKFAALGSLVAGIAHEVNTPLGIGVTAASYLEETVVALAKAFEAGTMRKSDLAAFIATARETARIILANLNRAASLVQSFKRIAVDQTDEVRQTIALAAYLKDIIVSLTPRLKKTRIRVTIDCPENLRVITMPGGLSQILTNFVTNSLLHGFEPDAEGGIVITARAREDAVVLVYTDDGQGIPPDHLHRVFEPFFTTKRGQNGSGLGLSLVYNIVTRNLKGQIEVASAPGKGTSFTITLPDSVA
ncbi:MAG: sensor histidine kinase [Candidatus Accumulibacter sp.]|jgi:signal transduction histidine kinase|nr:sensor histidine kinase [Accumulibacter sp.]